MIRGLVRLSADNPVLLNLVFFVVVIAGLLAYVGMPKEEFPQVSTDRVAIVVPYPGASPADIEDQIVREVEDAIAGVDGIKHVYADATEGRALLTVELVRGTVAEDARDEIRRAVDGIDDLPEDALEPRVSVAKLNIPLLHVALTGDTRRLTLAETIADELEGFPGVKEVVLQGADERRLRVELDPARASAWGVSSQEVAGALKAAATGAPAGDVSLTGQSVLVRTRKGVERPEDLAAVPLRVGDGQDLRVGDVARVREVWEAPDITVRVAGQPAIDLVVQRLDEADALSAVPAIASWVDERRLELPAGLDLVAYDDSARLVRDRLNILASNAGVGIVLVALMLVLFIGLRNAMMVVWGMPVAYLGAIAAMTVADVTINVVSTFGLLLVTGIIVDDAIVIVENVQRHLEMGKDRVTAAVDGAAEVFWPVASATLTTCLAFAPLLMLEGTVGRVMSIIPTVVILALVASLIEAFYVLPGHLSHFAQEFHGEEENLPTRLLKAAYRPLLETVTVGGRRFLALGVIVLLVGGSLGLAGLMRRSLTTPGNPVFALIDVDLPASSDPETTRGVVRDLERLAAAEAGDLTLYVSSRVGEQRSPQGFPTWGDRHGQLKIGFFNEPDVLDRVPGFLDTVRDHLAARPDVVEYGIQTLTGGPPSGRPIDVRVRSRDPERVDAAVDAVLAHLAERPGVVDVRVERGEGSASFDVRVDPAEAARFGLSEGIVAQAVRTAVEGVVAVEIPVEERTTEVRVSRPAPRDLAEVADLPVARTEAGVVRLRQVADVVRTVDTERISRVDGQRAVRVTADVEGDATSSTEERDALDAAFADLSDRFPGASLFYGGELADAEASFSQLPAAGLLAVLMIYAVLAVQFRSYVQPLIILAAVPLGAAGVVLGLFLFRMDLSLIAMIGAVGLVGIVVNDSLVLVDFINGARRQGLDARDAVIEASLVRLRPILITTVTTVLGLLPLALGIAGEEPLLAPMAVAISVGLAFATALTLVVVPVLYLVLEDVARWVRTRAPWWEAELAPASAAPMVETAESETKRS